MQKATLLVGFALVLASCGGAAERAAEIPATTVSAVPVENETERAVAGVPSSEVGGENSSTPTASSAPATSSVDGPPAPDFELAVADGSVFKLSDEQKPVYIVFWAEW